MSTFIEVLDYICKECSAFNLVVSDIFINNKI